MIENVLTFVGGSAVLIASLGWLIRSIVVHLLKADIEKYKSQLQTESAKEIERLKASLTIATQSHDIQFRSLHEKQAKLIEELYLGVNDLDGMAKRLIGNFGMSRSIQEKEEEAERVIVEYLEFNAKFHKNRLYFNEKICQLFDSYKDSIFRRAMKFLELASEQEKPEFV